MYLFEEDVGSDNISEITDYWDQFTEIVGTPFKYKPATMQKIQAVFAKIVNRNYIASMPRDGRPGAPNPLLTPGFKIQINDSEKNEMLEAIGVTMNRNSPMPNALTLVKNSRFYNAVSKREGMKEKISFFLPMVCYAANLYKIGKKNECQIIFNILAMVEYTSAVVASFYSIKMSGGAKLIHGTSINTDAMATVMEYYLNNKSEVKTKTIIEILQNKMAVSLNNYAEKNRYLVEFPITDKKLNEIVTAGIISRVGAFVHEIAEKYYKLLNDSKLGKAKIRSYSASSFNAKGEEGEIETVAMDYRSNASIVEAVVNNALTELSRPDPEIADMAVNVNFGLQVNNKEEEMERRRLTKPAKELLAIVSHVINDFSSELPILLRAILYAYLFDKKRDNENSGFKKGDVGFLKRATKAFNNNRLDKNVAIIKKKMNLFLVGNEDGDIDNGDTSNGSPYYLKSKSSTRGNIRNYLYNYFIIVLWNAMKVSF